MAERRRIGLLGARGYVGTELVRLVLGHPDLEPAYLGSRSLAGRPLRELVPNADPALAFEALSPEQAASRPVDAVVLALPNEASAPYVEALGDRAVLVDLSADHRFDDGWRYGLVELFRDRLRGARRISNPGCYATAAQIALSPIAAELAAPPRIFGVSGYSGAGTTPSDRNDPDKLRDNLMPYGLVGHTHEREIGRHLGHPVCFMPHVAPFFRGITLTIDCLLERPRSAGELEERYRERYRGEPLVHVTREAPQVRAIAGRHHVSVGGFACDGRRAVLVATIDNLLKGAATQALQNLNLALGLAELAGVPLEQP